MYFRVFKPKDSRVYRVRYSLSNGPKIYDKPLRTHLKEVADVKATQLVREEEMQLLGLGVPKTLAHAAQLPIAQHLADYITDLEARERSKSHVLHAKYRLQRLFKDCRWHLLRDVTADRFLNWRGDCPTLSVKTRNEYLAHALAFFNWLMRQERATNNPLKSVFKLSGKGQETFKRRYLSFAEVVLLVESSGRRGLVYFVATCTGLRRNEIKQLLWTDIDLDADKPHMKIRAETTKAKRGAVIPLIPPLAAALRAAKPSKPHFSGRVFPRGIPSVTTLTKDLQACGIAYEDARGHRVDFHALRHTFASLLASAEVPELVRMKLARHTEWKQTDRYTDPASVPLFSGIEKFGAALPSSIASLNSGKTGPNEGKVVQVASPILSVETFVTDQKKTPLVIADQRCPLVEMVPKGGLEPPCF
ncbi:putative Site-specific recombinase XerD [uncultured Defluviicoccus sp.]|uniref:Putative Site-specific recombinase XerD n=1 Tax=metagenome TaxID=256318 RepID=A0A380TIY9_9ZZZZ|nr:putative Site-specific recombinase XerD [uncultured Defluviicoccus sp.]